MALDAATLTTALQTVRDPHTGQDFVSTKALKNLQIEGTDVAFEVVLGYPAKSLIPGLRQQLIAAAKTVPGVGNVSVQVRSEIIAHAAQRGVQLLPQVRNIIGVASGKAGWAKAPPRLTSPWPWPPKARAWACSTPTSTARASP